MKLFNQYIRRIHNSIVNIKTTRKLKSALGETYSFREFILDIKLFFKSSENKSNRFPLQICDEHDLDVWLENDVAYGQCKNCGEVFILNTSPVQEIIENHAMKNMQYRIKKAIEVLGGNN